VVFLAFATSLLILNWTFYRAYISKMDEDLKSTRSTLLLVPKSLFEVIHELRTIATVAQKENKKAKAARR
jgi:hypothetical protein